VTVGSSAYISPEQIAAAEDIDYRTDIYALGCLLFECLAGRPPYQHANEHVVLQMHVASPIPDVRHFRREAPGDLAEILKKAMAKSRADRWESAVQMAKALG
jgi:eukaryotic-like serine/threonine-protein kinase